MRDREHVERSTPEVARRRAGPSPTDGARQLLTLQRSAGNAAVSALVRRRFDAADGSDPDLGPVKAIENSALSGEKKANADDALKHAKAKTAFDALPWVKKRAEANGGKVPNSVKKSFKWAWPHRNNSGNLPGKKGAGGYLEYYIRDGLGDDAKASDAERLVISDTTNDVFHTATHYGDHGDPAFTHYT